MPKFRWPTFRVPPASDAAPKRWPPCLDLAHLRLAARATIAALLAYGIAYALDLPKGYWAVLSAILVVQSSLGASVAVALDRGLGTVAGGIIGVALAMIAGPSQNLTVLLLAVGTLATALLAAYRPSFKLAPVTVVVVMLADPTHAQPLISGLQRVFEIALGGVVGILCALLVFPTRAMFLLFPHAADAIDASAALLEEGGRGLLDGTLDPAQVDRLNAKARATLRAADVRVAEARRERAGRLSSSADATPVVRLCRRLWHSVIILMRVADQPLPATLSDPVRASLQAAVAALATECRDLAESLRTGAPLRPVPVGDPLAGGPVPGGAVQGEVAGEPLPAGTVGSLSLAAVAALEAEMDRAGAAGLLRGDGASLTRLYTAVSACAQVQENLSELQTQLQAYRADDA